MEYSNPNDFWFDSYLTVELALRCLKDVDEEFWLILRHVNGPDLKMRIYPERVTSEELLDGVLEEFNKEQMKKYKTLYETTECLPFTVTLYLGSMPQESLKQLEPTKSEPT